MTAPRAARPRSGLQGRPPPGAGPGRGDERLQHRGGQPRRAPRRPRRRPGLRPELLPHRGRRALRPAGGQRLLQQEGPEEHLAEETQAGHRQERESPGPGRVPAPARSRRLPPNCGRDSGALPVLGLAALGPQTRSWTRDFQGRLGADLLPLGFCPNAGGWAGGSGGPSSRGRWTSF